MERGRKRKRTHSTRKGESVGEKLLELYKPELEDFDPENAYGDETAARLATADKSEIFEAAPRSRLRRNVPLDSRDPVYAGKVVKPKEALLSDSSGESESESGSEEGSVDEESEVDLQDEEEEEDEEEEGDALASNASVVQQLKALREQDSKLFRQAQDTTKETLERAMHSQSQARLWEAFATLRIRLQKLLLMSNRCPQHDTVPVFKRDPEVSARFAASSDAAKELLCDLLDLRTLLFKQHSDLKHLCTDAPHAEHASADQLWEEVVRGSEGFESFRDSTIQHWNERTQLASGAMLQQAKQFKRINQSALAQISQTLTEMPLLVARSQVRRPDVHVLGDVREDEVEHDPEVFDDSGFYHALLREVVSGDRASGELEGADSWRRTANKRTKRKVDRRASKGRQTRYTVHPKLVNFMAPVPLGRDEDDVITQQLFRSLFGGQTTPSAPQTS